jgi:lipoprotein signal peptidase
MKKFIFWFSCMVFIDQISKFLAGKFGGFTVLNAGFSFGLGKNLDMYSATIIVILVALAIAWGLRSYWQKHPLWAGIFFGAVISNLIDRLIYGSVVDWLKIPGLDLRNNLADIAVVAVMLFKVAPDLYEQKNEKHES